MTKRHLAVIVGALSLFVFAGTARANVAAPSSVLPGYTVTSGSDFTPALTASTGCAWYGHDFTAKSYSWAGLWQFTYHSKWQWEGCGGRVVSASHTQRGDTAVGWGYDGFSNGNSYGCINCSMVGRETYGHFSFLKYAIHDTADLQVQVHGNGGWWAWANITGP